MAKGRKRTRRTRSVARRKVGKNKGGSYRRHELTDEQWHFVRKLIPPRSAATGRRPQEARLMLNGILWVLRTVAPWRDLPDRFGPYQTVYDYFRNWRSRGVYSSILKALHIDLDRKGRIDWDLWCVDESSVRAARSAAGAAKKVSNATRTSRKTTRRVARAADSQASSIWLRTVEASR